MVWPFSSGSCIFKGNWRARGSQPPTSRFAPAPRDWIACHKHPRLPASSKLFPLQNFFPTSTSSSSSTTHPLLYSISPIPFHPNPFNLRDCCQYSLLPPPQSFTPRPTRAQLLKLSRKLSRPFSSIRHYPPQPRYLQLFHPSSANSYPGTCRINIAPAILLLFSHRD
jgi:hypothetical protein